MTRLAAFLRICSHTHLQREAAAVPTTAIPTTVIPTTGQWAIGLISVFRDHGRKQLSAPFPESRYFALCRQQLFRQLLF